MTSNVETTEQTIDFNFGSGLSKLTLNQNLWEGKAIAAAVYINGTLPNNTLITLGIDDSGGQTIIEKTPLQNWQQRSGGNYLQSLKPIHLKNRRDIKLVFTASQNLAADLQGQIVFVIEKNC